MWSGGQEGSSQFAVSGVNAVVRWANPSPRRHRPVRALLAATLLHVAVFGWIALAIHLPEMPLAADSQAVDLVFSAPAPHAAPPPVPEPETPAAAVAPPEPPPPPPVTSAVAVPQPLPPPTPPTAAAEALPLPKPPSVIKPPLVPPVPAAPRPPHKPPPRTVPARRSVTPPAERAPAPAQATTTAPAMDTPTPPSASPPSEAPASLAPSQAARPAPIAVDWQNALSGWLAAHKTYPEEARRRGDEGRAVLRFTVDRDGKVLAVELVHGTGSRLLDSAALSLLNGASLPPFPATMAQERITVTVQIRYQLTD
jgi:protein TonB